MAISVFLLLIEALWGFIDAKNTGVFNFKYWLINFYDSFQILFPFITFLSGLFVYSEMQKFQEISVFEVKGISELQIFRTFFYFGLFCSFLSFILGCFVPYPYEKKEKNKTHYSVDFTTPKIFLWIENYNNGIGENVIFKMNNNETLFTCYANKAEFSKNMIVFYNGFMTDESDERRNFNSFVLNVNFNPLHILEYLTLPLDRQSFFNLYPILKSMAQLDIKAKDDWISLFSKISYPLLNFFIMILLIPFFSWKKFLSRPKVFIIAFIFALLTYSLYTAGLSLGKAEIIPWQISPWLSHIVLSIVFARKLIWHTEIKGV
ncbi:MAG: LptF/LptG family permease [Candidatus Omnitrophica bacterium]|nr:LptF/LptG family permease [Candidatus Omnitrophota bacterium]